MMALKWLFLFIIAVAAVGVVIYGAAFLLKRLADLAESFINGDDQ